MTQLLEGFEQPTLGTTSRLMGIVVASDLQEHEGGRQQQPGATTVGGKTAGAGGT